MTSYNIIKAQYIWDVTGTNEIRVCPECAYHTQRTTEECHDCKNTFHTNVVRDGRIKQLVVGQCQCYSKEHGMRE